MALVADASAEAYQYVSHALRHNLHPSRPGFYMLVMPVAAYWTLCILYDIISRIPALDKYRLHTHAEEAKRNVVTKRQVVLGVITQHVIQCTTVLGIFVVNPRECEARPDVNLGQASMQFVLTMIVYDFWQYCIHRLMHESKFLYRTVHSRHHLLVAPYAYGALYNHPIEAFMLDVVGGLVAHAVTGSSCGVEAAFWSVASMKTVLDHCGYKFPINPVHCLFENNSTYHNLHHDFRGIKKNFGQPFFSIWDRMFGTYMDPVLLEQDKQRKTE